MLAEDRRHLDLRRRPFITAAVAVKRASAFASLVQDPIPLGGMKEVRWCLFAQRAALQEGNIQLRESEYFMRCSKPAWYLHKKETLSLVDRKVNDVSFALEGYTISFKAVHFINILEKLNKTISVSACKKFKGPRENCFSTILKLSITLFFLSVQFHSLFILQKVFHLAQFAGLEKSPPFLCLSINC